jgi:hypothetical protein
MRKHLHAGVSGGICGHFNAKGIVRNSTVMDTIGPSWQRCNQGNCTKP